MILTRMSAAQIPVEHANSLVVILRVIQHAMVVNARAQVVNAHEAESVNSVKLDASTW